MDDLRTLYLDALRPQIDALEAAQQEGGEVSALRVRRIAHSLRGSGGTYGFAQVSSTAAGVEAAAAEFDPTVPATAELLAERVAQLLAVLRAALRSAGT